MSTQKTGAGGKAKRAGSYRIPRLASSGAFRVSKAAIAGEKVRAYAKAMRTGSHADARVHYVTVRQIGGSEMCAIPKSVQEEWGEVRARTKLTCRVEGSRLIFERVAKPRLTLKERIAMCDLDAPMGSAEREWMDDRPVGEELL